MNNSNVNGILACCYVGDIGLNLVEPKLISYRSRIRMFGAYARDEYIRKRTEHFKIRYSKYEH